MNPALTDKSARRAKLNWYCLPDPEPLRKGPFRKDGWMDGCYLPDPEPVRERLLRKDGWMDGCYLPDPEPLIERLLRKDG